MRFVLALATLALTASAVLPTTAFAQSYDDLDEDGAKQKKKKERKSARDLVEEQVIREIERGWYIKSGAGGGAYLGRYGGVPGYGSVLSSVITVPLTFGQDFVDKERQSMSWEITFQQAVYNGMNYQIQGQALNQGAMGPNSLIQGDTRMFQLFAVYEFNAFVSRRFGIGPRVGAGVMFTPLLMDREAYERDVVQGTWGGQQSKAHSSPHVLGFLGLDLEYYTKLSHFSIGANVDVSYQLDYDVNINGVGYLKYTF